MGFCEDYSSFFISQGRNRSLHARQYLSGLLGDIRRKNIERIGEEVAELDYQSVHNFVSESQWDYRALVDQVAKDADLLLGGNEQSMLLLDETSFLKKGRQSVGVARQYCGCSGKIENGQVAVLGALGCGRDVTLIDYRLYLPESWTDDSARLDRAKVPADERAFWTKPELALQVIETAIRNKLQFSWVGMDSLYGSNKALLKAIEEKGLHYLADVRSNQRFYFKAPNRDDADETVYQQRVDKIWREYAPSCTQSVRFRQASKGTLKAQVLVLELCDQHGVANGRRLVISCDQAGAIKYSLTNGTVNNPREVCYRQHQRYWIERAIQEAKSEVGMAQYQVRGWFGWHQHIAMVTLAMLFALQQKLAYRDCVPLLSTHDIVELLSYYLPSKKHSEQQMFKMIAERHKARLKAIEHYYRNKEPDYYRNNRSLTM